MSKATENNYWQGENVVQLRTKNRRIIVEKEEEDAYTIRLIRTTTPEDRKTIKESDNVKFYAGGKIMMTCIKLTREALNGLLFVLAKFFEEGML